MPKRDGFVEDTLALLEPLGPVQARAMFGGWGLYLGGAMFGLIAEERLYLKVDDETRPAFQSAGGEPFVYDAGNGRSPVMLGYFTPPPEASDDSLALLPWARKAVEASQRALLKKAAKKAPKKEPTAKKAPRRRR